MALQYAAFSLLGVPLEEESLVCLVLCDEVPLHLLFASSGESTANISSCELLPITLYGMFSYFGMLYCTKVLILSGPFPRLPAHQIKLLYPGSG